MEDFTSSKIESITKMISLLDQMKIEYEILLTSNQRMSILKNELKNMIDDCYEPAPPCEFNDFVSDDISKQSKRGRKLKIHVKSERDCK